MSDRMEGHDTYIKLTDPSGNREPVINHHRTWNRQRFIEAQRKFHLNQKDEKDVRHVSLSTEAEYKQFKRGDL